MAKDHCMSWVSDFDIIHGVGRGHLIVISVKLLNVLKLGSAMNHSSTMESCCPPDTGCKCFRSEQFTKDLNCVQHLQLACRKNLDGMRLEVKS